MNISLIDSLAQVILSLPPEEQRLLRQRLVQQPQQQPQQSRRQVTRRRVTLVESGDSFDSCVAESLPESFATADYSENRIESQPQPSKICSVEERSQKSLFIFRNCLQL